MVILIVLILLTSNFVYASCSYEVLQKTINKVVAKASKSTVFVGSKKRRGGGTGIIIDERGYVLTNYHVIASTGKNPVVELYNGKKYTGEVKGHISWYDLAIIKISGEEPFPALSLGDSSKLKEGDFVIAIGNPFMYKGTATFGIVSGTNRVFPGQFLKTKTKRAVPVIQTDASINPGNSGGPLLNIYGEVVGINTAILGPRLNMGIGFSVTSKIIKEYLDDLIGGKRFKEWKKEGAFWIGLRLSDINEDIKEKYNIEGGVLIREIDPRGPADESDLEEKDIIIEINKEPVFSKDDIDIIVSSKIPGEELTLTVLRDNEKEKIKVKVAKWGER